jgi:hypothetical protein
MSTLKNQPLEDSSVTNKRKGPFDDSSWKDILLFYFFPVCGIWDVWLCWAAWSPAAQPRLAIGPPLASVMENWEEFYGCLSSQLSFSFVFFEEWL